MKITQHQQGSDAWLQFRLTRCGASEAAAMLGLSKKVTRNELLRIKKTGQPKEFSSFVQERILDHGHAVEAKARPIIEEKLGEELYPVTCEGEGDDAHLSASCDGLTLDGDIAFEHKQWNEALATWVRDGGVPEDHMPQCQQILLVTGAKKVLFVVSDGTADRMVMTEVFPDPAWFKQIRAGWKLFLQDLETFVPTETKPVATAAPVLDLPAVAARVEGTITVTHNIEAFGAQLRAYVEKLPVKPSTDQEFADAKHACTVLQRAQDSLDAAEQYALAQISAVDEMQKVKALYFDMARTARLALEKLVKAREEAVRQEIITARQALLNDHRDKLNERLGSPWIPQTRGPFAEAIKGKRTVATCEDAADTALANAKIAMFELADRLDVNRKALRTEGADWFFLFADFAQVGTTEPAMFEALAAQRITKHLDAEAARKKAQEEMGGAQATHAPAAAPAATIARETAPAKPAKDDRPPLSTGAVGDWLGFPLKTEFIEGLGIKPVPSPARKSGVFWAASDLWRIRDALIAHLEKLEA